MVGRLLFWTWPKLLIKGFNKQAISAMNEKDVLGRLDAAMAMNFCRRTTFWLTGTSPPPRPMWGSWLWTSTIASKASPATMQAITRQRWAVSERTSTEQSILATHWRTSAERSLDPCPAAGRCAFKYSPGQQLGIVISRCEAFHEHYSTTFPTSADNVGVFFKANNEELALFSMGRNIAGANSCV